jgi:hypothetical protein
MFGDAVFCEVRTESLNISYILVIRIINKTTARIR